MNILALFSSARRDGSVSRQIAERYLAALREHAPAATIVARDLGAVPIPHIDAAWTAANATPASARSVEQRAALALSDTLIAELRSADLVILATPMYNFGLPSTVKAWFDHVTRAGETFRYDSATGGYSGLLSGKRALLISASAGDYTPGTPAAAVDFLTGYTRFLFGFIGITDVTTVAAGGTTSAESRARALAVAGDQARDFAGFFHRAA